MYDFVYLSVRRSVRDSHCSRDYRDGTGIRVFYENPGFYKAKINIAVQRRLNTTKSKAHRISDALRYYIITPQEFT
jgi:hypothetical protein